MDAYSVDYKKSMKAFEDMTDTEVYDWEVGYERYDYYLLKPIIDYYDTWCTYPENFSLEDLIEKC